MTPPAAAASSLGPAQPLPRRRPAQPPRPRRVSGPARQPARQPARPAARPAGEAPAQAEGLVVGLLRGLEALAAHRMLDRLIRGRLWIGIIAFALIGIVTLQLGLLRLNSGIGRALEQETSLQRENAALSIENSELASGDRVESQAARLGMQLVPMAGLRFLNSNPAGDVARAAARLREPLHASGQPPASVLEADAQSSASAGQSTEPSGEASGAAGTQAESGTGAAGGAGAANSGETSAAGSEAAHAGGEAGAGGEGAAASAGGAAGAAVTAPVGTGASTAGGGTAAPGG